MPRLTPISLLNLHEGGQYPPTRHSHVRWGGRFHHQESAPNGGDLSGEIFPAARGSLKWWYLISSFKRRQ